MKFAIIAAGDGSRLAQEGVKEPKPMVRVGGEMLVDRLIRIFMENGATEIVVICNERMTEVSRHLVNIQNEGLRGRPVPLRFIIKSTPSSMHSFHELSRYLNDGPFVLTTVDTIFNEDEFRDYVEAFRRKAADGCDALMGVTDYIDDEKPLYVGVSNHLTVNGYYDFPQPGSRYISAGIYGLTPAALPVLDRCVEQGESRMRNFQRALVAAGLRIEAYPLTRVFDIDHAQDIEKANQTEPTPVPSPGEESLQPQAGTGCLLIQRAERYSPNSVEKDAAILQEVSRLTGGTIIGEDNLPHPSSPITAHHRPTPITHHPSSPLILSMARSPEALAWLEAQEQQGVRVINPPAGVRACRRSNISEVMQEHHLPQPPAKGQDGYWVKRGDSAAQSHEDVRYCHDETELEQAKTDFLRRGITDFIVQAHVRGDLVKFYGVAGTDFFRCFYPGDDGDTKFGDEALNGRPHHYSFPHDRLRTDADTLARLLRTPVYGGDAVIRADGTYAIIDFNDWPSFSRCREEAAKAITSLYGPSPTPPLGGE
ncbi:MAG: NTP transferase domain-containing protein [Prevotella sp.]|nr:NTP transferase domain-containing protein [Prevotella sp.]